MNNKKLLLSLLSLMLALRFIIVPLIDWQNSMLDETQRLQTKLDKSSSFIDNLPKLVAYKDTLSAELERRHQAGEVYYDVGRYQIEKQRQFEQLFDENNIKISSSDWFEPIVTKQGTTLQLKLQFAGKLSQFIHLQTQIATLSNDIRVADLSLSMQNQSSTSLGRFNGNATIIITPLERRDADN
jgi:hypothetical protein